MKKSNLLTASLVLAATSLVGVMPASAEEIVVTERVIPEYPAKAERFNKEGSVELAFDITDAGSVQNVRVVESENSKYFDEAAVEAISQWKFEQGAPNEGVNVVVDFEL